MAKILVTGSNGQLGSEIKFLSKLVNHSFIFTDYKELDITSETDVEKCISRNKVDFVINCAAYTAVDKAEDDEQNAHLLNAIAPSYLAKSCKKNKAIFIQVSTDYVFDGTATSPIAENEIVNPQSIYGKTKLEGEQLTQKENPESIIIRTSWLYSSFGNNFVKTMIRLGEEKDSIGVVADQKGTPTYAFDLARTILQIIDKVTISKTNLVSGIFHYSNLGETTWCEFAKEIHAIKAIKCTVNPVTTEEYPTPAKRPKYSVLDKTKIQNSYNITIPEWKASLVKCIDKL